MTDESCPSDAEIDLCHKCLLCWYRYW